MNWLREAPPEEAVPHTIRPGNAYFSGRLSKRSNWLQRWNVREVWLLPQDGNAPPSLQWQGPHATNSIRVDEHCSAHLEADGTLVVQHADASGSWLFNEMQWAFFRSCSGAEPSTQQWLQALRDVRQPSTERPRAWSYQVADLRHDELKLWSPADKSVVQPLTDSRRRLAPIIANQLHRLAHRLSRGQAITGEQLEEAARRLQTLAQLTRGSNWARRHGGLPAAAPEPAEPSSCEQEPSLILHGARSLMVHKELSELVSALDTALGQPPAASGAPCDAHGDDAATSPPPHELDGRPEPTDVADAFSRPPSRSGGRSPPPETASAPDEVAPAEHVVVQICSRKVLYELLVFLVLMPAMGVLVGLGTSALLSAFEGWDYVRQGIPYTLSAQIGLVNPLGAAQTISPQTALGRLGTSVCVIWVLSASGVIAVMARMSHLADILSRIGRISEEFVRRCLWHCRLARRAPPPQRVAHYHIGAHHHVGVHRLSMERNIGALLINTIVSAPLLVLAICTALGPVLALVEGWKSTDGIYYLLGNAAALPNPLVSESPQSVAGSILGVYISIIVFQSGAVAIGIGAELAQTVATFLPPHWAAKLALAMRRWLCCSLRNAPTNPVKAVDPAAQTSAVAVADAVSSRTNKYVGDAVP